MSPVLPFLETAVLVEQGGAVAVEEVPVSVWPATASHNSTTGRHHTHGGEADLAFADALRVPNRALVVNGETFKIVAATPMDLVPHVVMELLLTSGRS